MNIVTLQSDLLLAAQHINSHRFALARAHPL
jgi:hypothetical protein